MMYMVSKTLIYFKIFLVALGCAFFGFFIAAVVAALFSTNAFSLTAWASMVFILSLFITAFQVFDVKFAR